MVRPKEIARNDNQVLGENIKVENSLSQKVMGRSYDSGKIQPAKNNDMEQMVI